MGELHEQRYGRGEIGVLQEWRYGRGEIRELHEQRYGRGEMGVLQEWRYGEVAGAEVWRVVVESEYSFACSAYVQGFYLPSFCLPDSFNFISPMFSSPQRRNVNQNFHC